MPNTAAPSNWARVISGFTTSAGIHCRIDPGNSDLALIVHFDFDDRGHISQKAPMCGNAQSRSFAELAFSPSCFLCNHLRDPPQTAGLPRIGIERSSIVRVVHMSLD